MKFLYDNITKLIMQKLKEGVVPWRKTWTTAYPRNFISGLEYKGINILLLGLQNYESNYWLSFKQVKDLGGSVKKDEKSSLVVFWKPFIKITDSLLEDELADIKFMLRYYYVFNIEQCILPDKVLEKRILIEPKPVIKEAEEMLSNFKNPPEISISNIIPNPRYIPRLDKIEIQSINHFSSSSEYYASLFHELIHSTGAKNRLARKGLTEKSKFDSENYSKEELIAEIGASFLCNIAGITQTIDSNASYIDGWLKALKEDNRMILLASAQAQKACDYILNNNLSNYKKEELCLTSLLEYS